MNSRDTKIIEWRGSKITQQEIAKNLGITRQRVQQLERKLGLGARRIPGIPTLHAFVCKNCGKESNAIVKDRQYCNRVCFFQSRKELLTPEQRIQKDIEKREKNRVRANYYYHNVLKKRDDWKEIIKKRNKKNSITLKKHGV